MKRAGLTVIELLVFIVVIAVCVIFADWVGGFRMERRMRAEALRVGVAHYEMTDDGKAECVWNVPNEVTTQTNRHLMGR